MTQAPRLFKPLARTDRSRAPTVTAAMPRPMTPAYNRDEDQKPGAPQRMAQEPKGAEGSSRSTKTADRPGERRAPHGRAPAPNQAETDQTDGARAAKRR